MVLYSLYPKGGGNVAFAVPGPPISTTLSALSMKSPRWS
jgi:RNA 3'-terminal phosphate cyclase